LHITHYIYIIIWRRTVSEEAYTSNPIYKLPKVTVHTYGMRQALLVQKFQRSQQTKLAEKCAYSQPIQTLALQRIHRNNCKAVVYEPWSQSLRFINKQLGDELTDVAKHLKQPFVLHELWSAYVWRMSNISDSYCTSCDLLTSGEWATDQIRTEPKND
jgi:hypothetical protein